MSRLFEHLRRSVSQASLMRAATYFLSGLSPLLHVMSIPGSPCFLRPGTAPAGLIDFTYIHLYI